MVKDARMDGTEPVRVYARTPPSMDTTVIWSDVSASTVLARRMQGLHSGHGMDVPQQQVEVMDPSQSVGPFPLFPPCQIVSRIWLTMLNARGLCVLTISSWTTGGKMCGQIICPANIYQSPVVPLSA